MLGPARSEIGMFEDTKSDATAAYFRIDYTYFVINRASEIVGPKAKYNFSVMFMTETSNKTLCVAPARLVPRPRSARSVNGVICWSARNFRRNTSSISRASLLFMHFENYYFSDRFVSFFLANNFELYNHRPELDLGPTANRASSSWFRQDVWLGRPK